MLNKTPISGRPKQEESKRETIKKISSINRGYGEDRLICVDCETTIYEKLYLKQLKK